VPGVNSVTVRETDFPLTIRNVREKDRIRMRFGTKKVHRFFIDRRIPLCFRDSWPIAENAAGEIILVPGLGCDRNHYSIWPDFSVIQYSH
jgi:tRNA(Ile)-lysidine synthase